MDILGVIGISGIVSVIGFGVWLIRMEGSVRANAKDIKRLERIEAQTQDQEIRISQRDGEMRAINYSLDELKNRVSQVESNQVSTGETLARIETKLDFMLEQKGKEGQPK